MSQNYLKKEDYEEPQCLLDMHPEVTPIPIRRFMEKLDEHLGRNDYAAAERHLHFWLAEAELGHDMQGKLTVLNEQIGLYRKIKKEPECMEAIEAALVLADTPDMQNTVTLGTTLVNAATAYNAFGKADRAVPLDRKAQAIYEAVLAPDDGRLGGLYNNMALAMAELGDYREAEELFKKALNIMAKQEHGEAEMAITYLNLADLIMADVGAEAGEQRIGACLDKARELLETEDLPRNGYYAFVCEKCAPAFGYHGDFVTERILAQRAKEIYERS